MPCGSQMTSGTEPASSMVNVGANGCACATDDTRAATAGVAGACKLVVSITSVCEELVIGDDGQNGQEHVAAQQVVAERRNIALERAEVALVARAATKFCRATYEISCSNNSTATITRFTVAGETFPVNIAPGGTDIVTILTKQPATCDVQRVGIIEGDCPGGGGLIRIDSLKVCVLSGTG